jgi:hypothetical protein
VGRRQGGHGDDGHRSGPLAGGGLTPALRDSIVFCVGIGGIVNEVFFRAEPERPTILLLLSGMVGLPAFLRADERAERRKDQGDA